MYCVRRNIALGGWHRPTEWLIRNFTVNLSITNLDVFHFFAQGTKCNGSSLHENSKRSKKGDFFTKYPFILLQNSFYSSKNDPSLQDSYMYVMPSPTLEGWSLKPWQNPASPALWQDPYSSGARTYAHKTNAHTTNAHKTNAHTTNAHNTNEKRDICSQFFL